MTPQSERRLYAAIDQVNEDLKEPLAPPRYTKVRRVMKEKVRRIVRVTDESAKARAEKRAAKMDGLVEGLADLATATRKSAKRVERLEKLVGEPLRTTKRVTTEPPKLGRKQPVATAVSIQQLAKEAKMQEQLARLHIRKAGIEKPGTRWQWPQGSRELKRVRKVLELPV